MLLVPNVIMHGECFVNYLMIVLQVYTIIFLQHDILPWCFHVYLKCSLFLNILFKHWLQRLLDPGTLGANWQEPHRLVSFRAQETAVQRGQGVGPGPHSPRCLCSPIGPWETESITVSLPRAGERGQVFQERSGTFNWGPALSATVARGEGHQSKVVGFAWPAWCFLLLFLLLC